MKLYDNDAYREKFMEIVYGILSNDETNDRANQIIDAFDNAPQVETEDLLANDPLTLEQLREMDGEPVYSPRLQEWGLVAAGGFTVTNMVYICDKAGNLRPATVWLACGPVYRYKPKEQSC